MKNIVKDIITMIYNTRCNIDKLKEQQSKCDIPAEMICIETNLRTMYKILEFELGLYDKYSK